MSYRYQHLNNITFQLRNSKLGFASLVCGSLGAKDVHREILQFRVTSHCKKRELP
jgi:hypothetical protein